MANIGDLFYTFRGDGARLQKDAQVEGGKAGQSLGKSMADGLRKSWSGAELGRGLVQGLGLAGGLGAAHLVTNAVRKVIDVFGDATAAAREEEDSVARLTTSLEQSVPGWDGNTEAIERTLQARMRLGFSDDEQRESLSRLVGATHDVTKALDLERVAMDLARFKRIGLLEASEALIKIDGGQFRALKALIGSTDDIKTAEEALAAVRKVAGGQAEKIANTNSGKLLASQVKFGEALEKLGAVTMPLVTNATLAFVDALDLLMGSQEQLAGIDEAVSDTLTKGTLAQMKQTRDALLQGIKDLGGSEPDKISVGAFVFGDQIAELRRQLALAEAAIVAHDDAVINLGKTYDRLPTDLERSVAAVDKTAAAFDATGAAAAAMAGAVQGAAADVVESSADMVKRLTADANDLVSDAFDPQIQKVKLLATNAEIAAAKRILASSKASKAEKTDARATLLSAGQDQAELLVKLAEAGQTTSNAYKQGISDLKAEIKNSSGPMKRALQGVLDDILGIEKAGKVVPVNFKVTGAGQVSALLTALVGHATVGGHGRAIGGHQDRSELGWVGERGTELFAPDTSGTVIPHNLSEAMAVGAQMGGNARNLTVNVNGPSRGIDTVSVIEAARRAEFVSRGQLPMVAG